MSSLITLQSRDRIIMASDTASSAEINGVRVRVSNKVSKLVRLSDNTVMFASGNLFIRDLFLQLIEVGDSVEDIERKLKEDILPLCGEYSLEVVVSSVYKSKSVVTTMSSYNSFSSENSVITTNDTMLFTAGIKTKEIANSFESNLTKHGVRDSIIESYRQNHCESIGGNLDYFVIDSLEISKDNFHIDDMDEYDVSSKNSVSLIVGERVYGKLIAGVNLVIEDESGIWITRGSRTTIYDRNQTEVMRLGLVSEDDETECFGLLSWNDITRVAITDCEGISVSRRKDSGWEKVFWVHPTNGTLYTKDMVAESLKIVSDIGETIIDVENGIFNLGWFKKILVDGKLTTTEKIEVWTKIATIMSEYEHLLEHAEQFKYSTRDDSYIFDNQNPETSRNPSTSVLVDPTDLTLRYNSLISFISNYISIPDDYDNEIMERTDEVDRDLFLVRFKDYYDAFEELKASIDNYLSYSGLNLGEFYNNLIIDAKAGFMAIRDDYSYRARLSATDGLALEKWEGGAWVKKLYGALGHPDYEDGTLIAENLVTRSLRIVDGELGDRIVFDQEDGISIFGDKSNIFLNGNDGIRIEVDGKDKFYVDTDGRLYAHDITTHNLKIVDGQLGEKIIFDHEDGITINGNDGEQIRLNANEGIAIDVDSDKRIWIGKDGLLYAKKLVVLGDEDDEVIEDVDGSYISDLTVNKLKTLNSNEEQDYVHIEDNFIQLITKDYAGAVQSGGGVSKFQIAFKGSGAEAYPHSRWGAGNQQGHNIGEIYKNSSGFYWRMKHANGEDSEISLLNSTGKTLNISTEGRMEASGKKGIRLEVDSNNYIFISTSGIKLVGSKIELN